MAVSGGLDSRTLFSFSIAAGAEFTPLFFRGSHMTPGETAAASAWLSSNHSSPIVIDLDILEDPGVRANTRERCYHCKSALFRAAADAAREIGVFNILDGTNASDHGEFRPGIRALEELGVRSPLAEAGLTKAEVRALAREIGLEEPDQPARACLLTRFAYGLQPDRELMLLIGRAEDRLMAAGLGDFRLRAPAAGELLLQVASAEKDRFQAAGAEIEAALSELPHPVRVEFPDKISGFYDRSD
jgi:uncharacterized protein